MQYKVVFSERAKKQLTKLDKHISALIIGWLEKNIQNCDNPRAHGKALVGDYRLICEIKDNEVLVLILNIGHRREIYNQ